MLESTEKIVKKILQEVSEEELKSILLSEEYNVKKAVFDRLMFEKPNLTRVYHIHQIVNDALNLLHWEEFNWVAQTYLWQDSLLHPQLVFKLETENEWYRFFRKYQFDWLEHEDIADWEVFRDYVALFLDSLAEEYPEDSKARLWKNQVRALTKHSKLHEQFLEYLSAVCQEDLSLPVSDRTTYWTKCEDISWSSLAVYNVAKQFESLNRNVTFKEVEAVARVNELSKGEILEVIHKLNNRYLY